VWSLATFYAHEAEQAHHYSEKAERAAADHIEKTCSGLNPAALIDCISEAIEAREETKRAEYDLSAQEQMALSTLWMTIFGGFSVLVSIGGVYLIWRTFDASRESIDAAVKMAKLAREANAVTREIGQAQVRAYISCDGGGYQVTEDQIVIKARFTNRGQSPTLNCEMKAKVHIMAIGTRPFELLIDTGLGVTGAGEVRKWSAEINRETVGEEIYLLLLKGAAVANIIFDVKWTDVFAKVQTEEIFLLHKGGLVDDTPNIIDGKYRRRKLNVLPTKINIEHK
jgi:hypothetical protein